MYVVEDPRIRLFGCLALVLQAVVGCAAPTLVTPSFETQAPPPFSPSGQVEPPNRWWTAFDVPALNLQVEDAFASNNTLAAAAERLLAARALTRREASDLFPDLNGVMGYSGSAGPGEDRGTFRWGLDAAYQVDLWGQIGSRVEAQRLRAEATDADYDALALTLAAEVTRTWFSLVEANAQVELLERQSETNRTGVDLQEQRFGEGLIRSPDVLRQRQLLESTLEQQAIARARTEVLEHRLAVLLGQMPNVAEFDAGSELPELPPLPATGLPTELLNRRPDIRREFLAFQAADRDLASAISSQFPRLNLSASLINAADHPETLLRDWFASIGGQLIAPLLDGGQRRAEVDRNAAVLGQRFSEYAETVLTALREVEDSLVQEQYQRERIKHLEAQVKLASLATEQLREQYQIQDIGYLDVLSAIQAEQRLQREGLSAQLELIQIRISLYLALAGDVDTGSVMMLDTPPPLIAPGPASPANPPDPDAVPLEPLIDE